MILNITTKVEKSIEQQWVEWMIDFSINKLSKKSFIENSRLCILLIKDDEPTYVLQLFFKSAEDYEKYINEFAARLHSKQQRLFGNHFVSFETLMQEII